MSGWSDGLLELARSVQESTILKGAISTLAFLSIILGLFVILAGLSWIIHTYIVKHEYMRMFHKFCVYVGAMGGVILFFIAGVMAWFLPILPGWILIFLAIIILRKHHEMPWFDSKLEWLESKLRLRKGFLVTKLKIKESAEKVHEKAVEVKEKIQEKKMGKSLRKKRKRKK